MQNQRISNLNQSILFLLLLAIVTFVILLSPIPQPKAYMQYADTRHFFGIPYFNNVFSNCLFAILGIIGLARPGFYSTRFTKHVYQLFFISIFLVSLGSTYYHWSPSYWTLLWDRLPITIAMMCFLTAMIAERMNENFAKICWIPLIIFGIFSACYWYFTETKGHGDLRLYLLTQLFPIIFIPALLIFSHKIKTGRLWLAIILYLFGRVSEHYDRVVYAFTHQIIGGHTLKHIFMAAAIYLIYINTRRKHAYSNSLRSF